MNLVDNAIRQTEPLGQVQVSLFVTERVAQLMVRDTETGIAPEHLPHLFERFYRADPARRQTGGSGTSLGRSMVEWIVHMHGGSVHGESQVRQGSCLTVMLPLTPLTPPVRVQSS